MVENLLHAQIVLSQDQKQALKKRGYKNDGMVTNGQIGTITLLGVDNRTSISTVHLLIRFEGGMYGTPITPMAIETALGKEFSVVNGNKPIIREYRVLVAMKIKGSLRNPEGFIRALSVKFARVLIRTTLDFDWDLWERDDYPEPLEQF